MYDGAAKIECSGTNIGKTNSELKVRFDINIPGTRSLVVGCGGSGGEGAGGVKC